MKTQKQVRKLSFYLLYILKLYKLSAMKASTLQRLRYQFDNFMSRGIGSMLIGLFLAFLASLGLVIIIRLATFYFFDLQGQYHQEAPHLNGDEYLDQDPFHHIYLTFLQMTDPGNMAQDIAAHPGYHISAIIAGMLGLILLSALVGLITTWLMGRMEQLRKGHSQVIEKGHVVILGWEPQRILEILRELIEANESEAKAAVCILAEKEKEEMDDFLSVHLPEKERLTTSVVTRSGSISCVTNLNIISVQTCRSVIVLSSCNQSASEEIRQISDARVAKAIMAVSSCDWESHDPEEYDELNIVAEIFNPHYRNIISSISKYRVTIIDAWNILAKIIVQTSRSVGLSVTYSELLSFEGCEMYFYQDNWKDLTFGEIQFHFDDGVPIGIRNSEGILINPPCEQKLTSDDSILIIADDDSTIHFSKKPVAAPSSDITFKESKLSQKQENILIIGWNQMAPVIIEQYADYILKDSSISILIEDASDSLKDEILEISNLYHDLNINLCDGDPFQVNVLKSANPSNIDNIIILNKAGDSTNAEKTDSETILILLLLRSIFEETECVNPPKLVAEVADSKNQMLVANSGVKDFIISNKLVSMIVTQISQEPDMKYVYDDLFEEDGSEIYLKPLNLYVDENELPSKLTFADCMRLAQQRHEVCIGIKRKELELDGEQNFGVKLIPEKNTTYELRADDCLVVVSEDET